jgi:glycine cleavage system transcriptional repressor
LGKPSQADFGKEERMQKNIVLTFSGHDRIGIVEAVTEVVARHSGNVESSRMARLGGEFAMLMLVSLPEQEFAGLDQGFQALRGEGYQIGLLPTESKQTEKFAGWLPYEIEVLGADHEGIIHEIAQHLSQQGINIESMDTSTVSAPMSGTPLFTMQALILVPPKLAFHKWSDALDEIGNRLNVNIKVSMTRGQ